MRWIAFFNSNISIIPEHLVKIHPCENFWEPIFLIFAMFLLDFLNDSYQIQRFSCGKNLPIFPDWQYFYITWLSFPDAQRTTARVCWPRYDIILQIVKSYIQGILASFSHNKISGSDINRLEIQAKTLKKLRT